MAINEKYSYKDFTHQKFTDTKPEEWEGEIVGSCFYNEKPKSVIFPEGIRCTFVRCNLDNIVVPRDCVMEACGNKLIGHQKDGEDWILDENLLPVEPLNKAEYVKLGLSTSPAALPADAKVIPVTQEKRQQLEDALQAQIKALEDAADWR